MKLRYIIIISALVLGLASCEYNSNLDDLEGLYDAPTTAELSLSSYSSELDGKLRYFTLDFTSSSVSLHTVLVGTSTNPYLPSNGYTEAYSSAAKNGYFIIDDTYVTVSGSSKTITDGTITVSESSTDTDDVYAYTISAVIFDEDGDAYKLTWEGEMTWEGDPSAIELTQVLSTTNWVAYGYGNYLSLTLATDDITSEFSWTTYTYSYTGTGYMLSIDIYSEDGYLHEGTYGPSSAGGSVEEGTYGIGYLYYSYYDYGTCWFTVTDGTAVAEYITEGDLVVTRTSSGWNISYDNGDIWCEFEGAIDDLTDPDDEYTGDDSNPDAVQLTQLLAVTNWYSWGWGNYATIKLGTDDVTYSYDSSTYTETISGDGYCLSLDIYVTDGYLYAGTYGPSSAGGSVEEGTYGIGYSYYGYYDYGTCWFELEDGESTCTYIEEGDITVTRTSAGFKISYDNGDDICFEYNGAIDALLDPDDEYTGDSGDDSGDYTELTELLSYTNYYTTYSTNLIGLELGTEDMTYSYDSSTYTSTYTGTGNTLKIEFYTSDGSIEAGTYSACETAGTVNAGEFGTGYDYEFWGYTFQYGSTWYTYEDGTATSYDYVTDGTLVVEANSDGTHTLTLTSTAVNATWTGTIE